VYNLSVAAVTNHQLGGFKAIEVYFLMVMKAKTPK
jgi:hypothetical protein